MKRFLTLFLAALLFFSLCQKGQAISLTEIEESLKENISLEDIVIPQESQDNAFLFGEDLSPDNPSGFFDFAKIFTFIFSLLTKTISEEKGYIVTLLSILIISFFLKTLGSGLSSEKTLLVVQNLVVLLSAVAVFFPLWQTLFETVSLSQDLSAFMSGFLPVFLSLSSLQNTSAVASQSAIAFFLSAFSFVMSAIIPIALSLFLSLGISSGLSENQSIKSLSATVRNITIAVMTAGFFIMTAVFSLQSGILGGAETISKKGIKFIVSSSVPIGGGFLSEGVDSIFSVASSLKKTFGGFGIVIIFLLFISPLVKLIICGIITKICTALSSFFSSSSLENYFSISFDSYLIILSFLLGSLISLSSMINIIINLGG